MNLGYSARALKMLDMESSLYRDSASPEKVGWKRDRIDGQKVYLTIFMLFLLMNEYRPEESGVDMSTPVHPVAPPLDTYCNIILLKSFYSHIIEASKIVIDF